MDVPCFGRVRGIGCRPTIRNWVVSPTRVNVAVAIFKSAPDNHFRAGPDGGVNSSTFRRIGGARRGPRVINASAFYRFGKLIIIQLNFSFG